MHQLLSCKKKLVTEIFICCCKLSVSYQPLRTIVHIVLCYLCLRYVWNWIFILFMWSFIVIVVVDMYIFIWLFFLLLHGYGHPWIVGYPTGMGMCSLCDPWILSWVGNARARGYGHGSGSAQPIHTRPIDILKEIKSIQQHKEVCGFSCWLHI